MPVIIFCTDIVIPLTPFRKGGNSGKTKIAECKLQNGKRPFSEIWRKGLSSLAESENEN